MNFNICQNKCSTLRKDVHRVSYFASKSNYAISARGFTLIELMIAVTLGLLVLAAISTILVNTGKTNREQTAVARMQENGRFALGRISADVRMAGAQYCSSFGTEIGSLTQGHRLRALRVITGAALPFGMPSRPSYFPVPAAGEAGLLSPRYFVQGHECSAGACAPLLNVLGAAVPNPPGAGTAVNQRVNRADVLTVRYLAGNGVPLAAAHPAGTSALNIAPAVATAPPLNFVAGDLAMVTDCVNAEVFSANAGGTSIVPAGNSGGNDSLRGYSLQLDPRVFNFTKDMWTVTYFLRMRTNADGGPSISALARQQNGVAQFISDGVERMEILYGVRVVIPPTTVNVHFLTAAQVQAGTSATGVALPCLPQPKGVGALEVGCLWRQVESIDVSLLLNTVTNVASVETEPFSYSPTGLVNSVPPATLPSGLPRGRMYRKEFRTRVNVRSFTY
jgi:type IV pilus assembly protein PilW